MPLSPAPAVLRACDVLDLLARHPLDSFQVAEIARRVGVPRATCDTVLMALAEGGLAVRDEGRRYQLGPACMALGDAARAANLTLRRAAMEAESLARATSSCVALAIRDRQETRITDVFDFGPPFGIRVRPGQAIRIVPPFGAVFMAWDDEAGVREWLAQPSLDRDPTEMERYRQVLSEVRQRGYSVTTAPQRRDLVDDLQRALTAFEAEDERDALFREMTHSEYLAPDVDARASLRISQMSAPVFDRSGRVAAAIMVAGPDHELARHEVLALGDDLLRAADRATRAAGGRSPDAAHHGSA